MKEISKSFDPDIIFLIETKNPDEFVMKKLESLRYEHHHLVSPTGHGAGGLALLWKHELNLNVLDSNAHVIDTFISFEGKQFYSSFVHGSTDKNQRNHLWDVLVTKATIREDAWFITGDFNDLLCSEEKEGGQERPEGSFTDMRTFFSEGDLFDLQHSGDPLSWRGQRGDHLVRCRLDRAAANTLWAERFPTARCQYLEADLTSDHKPLLSFFDKGGRRRRGNFRYDRRLCKNEEARKMISNAWRGAGQATVRDKLASTRSAISAWNKTQHRNSQEVIQQQKTALNAALSSPVNDIDLIQVIAAKLNAAYSAEEEYWRQRSRALWLKLGDRNTGYFHATTKNRKRINGFSVIEREDGQMVHKEEEIVQVIGDYFQKMFSSLPGEREDIVNRALQPLLTGEENDSLIAVPTSGEIRDAAFSINAEKAPGPDGFSAGFFHTHWEDVGPDIVKEVQGFFRGEPLPELINETNIRLIPKIPNPQKVSDYRPIALCNVYYKIFSKLLTRRLQPLLSKLISVNQSAFVPGRAIGDNILISHEVLHYLNTSQAEQRCAMAVKTDMSKAYDRLEWEFISLVMVRLGFHQDFVKCVMQCISSVTYSFLINGLPRGKVVPSRGIRQGDPLSPYIFIMCSEVLSGLCNQAKEDGSLQGIRVARGCPRINHLLFADDTMFFLETTQGNCSALTDILTKYESASGQTISKEKSAITFSRRTPAAIKEMVKEELQIQKEGGTGKYLGLPEQFGRRKRDIFSSIVDRIKQKARGWSNKFLSSAGKMVMLQSVLSAAPSYSMSHFALPVSLCKRIQSTVTRFWWDNNEHTRKMAWVSWDSMAKPKALGGLGFRDFQVYNAALLAKLSWRLVQNPDCLLGQVLLGKYCTESNVLTATGPSNMSHGWWSVLVGRDLLIKNLGWVVGNGQDIKVWDDPWLSFSKQVRPMGPPQESTVELRVSDLMCPGTCEWDATKIHSWLPMYEETIRCIKPSQSGALDRIIWLGTKSGVYSVKSGYYSAVDEGDFTPAGPAIASVNWKQSVWQLACAPKVKMFAWKLLKGALPVGERLVERHVPVDPACKRCGEAESINHLFFHCEFARKVWLNAPFSTAPDFSGLLDLAGMWTDLCSITCLPPSGITAGSLAPWILWSIWKERNKFVFEGISASAESTLSKAIGLAREWINEPNLKPTPSGLVEPINHPPPPNTVTIRSDAAWKGQGNRAGVGCFRIAPSGTRSISSCIPFVASTIMAEGLALLEAVKMGICDNLKAIRFESDSSQLIKAVNSGDCIPELYGVVSDILSLISVFDFVSFTWIPREFNIQADRLAKAALAVTDPVVVVEVFIPPN